MAKKITRKEYLNLPQVLKGSDIEIKTPKVKKVRIKKLGSPKMKKLKKIKRLC